jgi:simple sugar transport system permease protein
VRIVKREPLAWYYRLAVRGIAVVMALLVSSLIIVLLVNKNPIDFYSQMIKGAFGSSTLIWSLVQDIAILLCVSLAVTPAFKMKFWNIGAEGQALVGGLATVSVMMFCGDKLPTPVLLLVMLAASILSGIIWALLPAVCKALWNTNETLFTLMMNYVATQLVAFFLKTFVKDGSGVLSPMHEFGLPVLFGKTYLLNIIIVAVLTVLVYIYLKYSLENVQMNIKQLLTLGMK